MASSFHSHEASSLAKGVFAFKKGILKCQELGEDGQPVKKKAKKSSKAKTILKERKKKKKQGGQASEFSNLAKLIWKEAEESFEVLQKKMFSDVITAVTEFAFKSQDLVGTHGTKSLFDDNLVPTCTLLTGVNLPDHEDFFRLLRTELKGQVTPHVASHRVSGNMTLRNLMLGSLAQFMCVDYFDDEEDEIDEEGFEQMNPKKSQLSLSTLDEWYNNQYPKVSTREHKRKPLIIMLEDFEAFPSNVLQDFVLNILEFSSKLPFVFVFGVATTISVVHQKLPYHITSRLVLKKFAGQKSTNMLSKVVEKNLMNSDMKFKLSGRTLEMLLQIFIFSDFSVKRFLAGYKYALFEHFTSSELPELLCTDSKSRKKNILRMDQDLLDRCRSLQSFRRFVEKDPSKWARLLTDNDEFRTFLAERLDTLDVMSMKHSICVLILYTLVKELPGAPLGQQLYSVYRTSLLKNATETHEYRECYQMMKLLSGISLEQKLKIILDQFNENEETEIAMGIKSNIVDFLERLKDITSGHLQDSETNTHTPKSSRNYQDSPSGKKMTKSDLQDSLLKKTKDRKSKNPYEMLKKEILEFFHQLFETHLKSPQEFPFFELKYFDKVGFIKANLMAFPRGSIKTALEDPVVYLQCENLGISSCDEILPNFPDVSIAYKLHNEQSKLINMYDWLQSWLYIVEKTKSLEEEHDDGEEDKEENKEIDPVLHAKFTECVSALQFLGFIKPSKRKTDHMSKLTWGE